MISIDIFRLIINIQCLVLGNYKKVADDWSLAPGDRKQIEQFLLPNDSSQRFFLFSLVPQINIQHSAPSNSKKIANY